MGDLPTVKIKAGDSYANINKSDYDPDKHTLHPDENKDAMKSNDAASDQQRQLSEYDQAQRRYEANRGIVPGSVMSSDGRNPSGTYSEPTPTDIRYPNKDETEFENNHGAFINKSAAQMRKDRGLPDAPGGLSPQAPHVAKGPRGKWYVKNGRDLVSDSYDSEDEAKAEMQRRNDAEKSNAVQQTPVQAPAQSSTQPLLQPQTTSAASSNKS